MWSILVSQGEGRERAGRSRKGSGGKTRNGASALQVPARLIKKRMCLIKPDGRTGQGKQNVALRRGGGLATKPSAEETPRQAGFLGNRKMLVESGGKRKSLDRWWEIPTGGKGDMGKEGRAMLRDRSKKKAKGGVNLLKSWRTKWGLEERWVSGGGDGLKKKSRMGASRSSRPGGNFRG